MNFLSTRWLGAALIAAALAGCAAQPHTRVDRDPSVDLRAYRSFGWAEPSLADPAGYTGLVVRHLQTATRAALERQGYVYDERQPDLRVGLIAGVTDRVALRNGPGRLGRVETVELRQGTLVVDLIDTRQHALVWRGMAEGELGEDALKSPAATASAAVAKIFERFPDGAAR